jgi:hypothetical protein
MRLNRRDIERLSSGDPLWDVAIALPIVVLIITAIVILLRGT